ncbi:hypothetical protein SDC9_182782 [bioreactor metagenome]|uniref:Leucine-binding protein domain-containing protein n=1 Tax=bioreactor metagenome TaxID=1076179 RepID=A0A645H8H4_9ZZZZ
MKFLGPDGMDSAEVINIAGEAAIGTYYTSVAADISNTETGAKFATKYKETYSKNPEAFSADGYDAMNVTLDAVAAAIKANNGALPTREQVATAVRETKGFVGVATKVTLNDIGDNTEASVYILGFSKAAYPPDVISSIPVSEYLK